jgi:hypothetical protein
MAQANYVPTPLCAQITGAYGHSSTNTTPSISARLFAGLAEYTTRIEVRVCGEALCSVLFRMAGSAS